MRQWTPTLDTITPGRRANVFVHPEAPQYQAALEWAKTAPAAEWKNDPQGRPGIWVTYDWMMSQGGRATGFKRLAGKL